MSLPPCERCGNPVQSRSTLFCYMCGVKHREECDKIVAKIRADEAKATEKRAKGKRNG